MTLSRVVVEVDSSSASADAQAWATKLAAGTGAGVFFVHTTRPAESPESTFDEIERYRTLMTMRDAGWSTLRELAPILE